jgi:hypothetical protein
MVLENGQLGLIGQGPNQAVLLRFLLLLLV